MVLYLSYNITFDNISCIGDLLFLLLILFLLRLLLIRYLLRLQYFPLPPQNINRTLILNSKYVNFSYWWSYSVWISRWTNFDLIIFKLCCYRFHMWISNSFFNRFPHFISFRLYPHIFNPILRFKTLTRLFIVSLINWFWLVKVILANILLNSNLSL